MNYSHLPVSFPKMCVKFLYSLLILAAATLHTVAEVEDTIGTGNYLIHLCSSGGSSSNASYLQQLLPQIQINLQAVIADAKQGTASRHGYGALFKTDENIEKVMSTYQDMSNGSDILLHTMPGSPRPGLLATRPTFVCINDIPETEAFYEACMNNNTDTPLTHLADSGLVILCPLFWEQRKAAVARIDCPRLYGNSLSPNSMQLSLNQEAMIVHELAHLYADVNGWPNEIMNVQDAVNLNASASLSNANNYALYYAGQSIPP